MNILTKLTSLKTGNQIELRFGKTVTQKLLAWIHKNIPNIQANICDFGCGNGYFLKRLNDDYKYLNLAGVDYCKNLIQTFEQFESIKFYNLDLLSDKKDDKADEFYDAKFDLVFDKGTLDAISCGKEEKNIQKYIKVIESMLSENGVYLLTSCNFSKEELLKILNHSNTPYIDFEYVSQIEHESFKFGGKVGQTVTSIVLKKKK